MKWKLNLRVLNVRSIIILGICMMLLGSSWEAVLGTTYMDEIALVFLMGLLLIGEKKLDRYIWISFGIYCLLCICGMLFYEGGINNLLDALKPLTMFTIIYSFKLCDKECDFIITFFKVINIVSIFVGIMNYILFNILNTSLLLDTGTYKYINGRLVHRMSGFMRHSGFMAETCAALIIITLFQQKITRKNFVEIIFYFVGLYCTRGRLPLAIALCACAIFAVLKMPPRIRIRLFVLFLLAGTGGVIILGNSVYQSLLQRFSNDIENQIRFVALRRMAEVFDGSFINFLKKFFFGYGIGYLDNFYESHLAITFLNLGIIGVVVWYGSFLYAGTKMRLSGSKYKTAAIIIMGYYLMNTIFNKSYSLPLLEIVCVILAGNNEKQ